MTPEAKERREQLLADVRLLRAVRKDAREQVRAGILRAFPDLRLTGMDGRCPRCNHFWTVHDVPRTLQPRFWQSCGCCDKGQPPRRIFLS